jgi:hydroxymethylbilane synthase
MSAPGIRRIGARGSPLSITQTGLVRDALALAHPALAFEIQPIVTTGDRIQDRRLNEVGGKGLFTKELDEALLDGRIDLAVHSMKDLPIDLPEGIVLGASPVREEPRDALICREAVGGLLDLKSDASIGTASLRRQAQLLALRPSFQISMIRGNVETRLRKVEGGEVDATLLAFAGLRRLGLEHKVKALVDPETSPPSAGQGALAITCRREDSSMLEILEAIKDRAAWIEIAAERGFLGALDGSCRTPIAALGRWSEGRLRFIGESLTPDGLNRWRRTADVELGTPEEAEALGRSLGASIRQEAGSRLYAE